MPHISQHARLQALQRHLSVALAQQYGVWWKEAYCEAHAGNNELPVWVLLYDDSDPQQVHEVFRSLLVPFIETLGETQVNLSYCLIRQEAGKPVRYMLDYLDSTAHILAATSAESLGVWQKSKSSQLWMFAAADSRREG